MCAHVNGSNLLAIVSEVFFLYNPMYKPKIKFFIRLTFSWLCCYLAQMNPLIGPRMHTNTILIMAREWGSPIADLDTFVPPVTDLPDHGL